jgi:hypothetical protein
MLPVAALRAQSFDVTLEQITRGPKHHFFGYIGHVGNTPWNGDGRYMALLRTEAQDRMPRPGEAADIVLIDTKRGNAQEAIEAARAWNPQQGTMLYWNPRAAATQLVFNDRDPKTNRVFAVLYDIAARRRIREYRHDDTPFANGGVAQNGGYFLGINYGRMARLRPVTGYPGAYDWNPKPAAPADDGIFIVEIDSGRKRLLVSFEQLARAIAGRPEAAGKHLFINHTLWNRSGDRIFFFVRGADPGATWETSKPRLNLACTIRPDGAGLTIHRQFIGGHPEWESGPRMIGAVGDRQVIYDVDRQEIVGRIGSPEILPRPEGDIALSPDGRWLVNGYRAGNENLYVILRRSDGMHCRTRGIPVDGWTSGDLRLDAAPCWNRTGDAIAVPGIAADAARTRQTFVFHIHRA